MILLIPHRGTDVRPHESVDAAKAAIKAEFDTLYRDNLDWYWEWDRHEQIWFGHPTSMEDDVWVIREIS